MTEVSVNCSAAVVPNISSCYGATWNCHMCIRGHTGQIKCIYFPSCAGVVFMQNCILPTVSHSAKHHQTTVCKVTKWKYQYNHDRKLTHPQKCSELTICYITAYELLLCLIRNIIMYSQQLRTAQKLPTTCMHSLKHRLVTLVDLIHSETRHLSVWSLEKWQPTLFWSLNVMIECLALILHVQYVEGVSQTGGPLSWLVFCSFLNPFR
jgi:hypothetical protein